MGKSMGLRILYFFPGYELFGHPWKST